MTSFRGLRSFAFAFLFFCFSTFLYAQDLSYAGSLSALAGAGLPNTHDNKGTFLVGNLLYDNLVKASLGDSFFCFNAILVGDGVGSQSTNGLSALVTDDGHFAIKLKEAYFDYNGSFWALRAGRMIAAWGKADGIQITDVLCPQDESSMIASTYKESRQGIDAVRLSYTGEKVQADAYWIPLFTPSTLPLAARNPMRKILFPEKYGNYTLVTPKRYDDFDLPEKSLANSEYAARMSLYFSALDLSFYAFYGWDDLPFMTYTVTPEAKVNVTGGYERMTMFGLDAAIPAGDFVFRFESAYFPRRYVQTADEWQARQQAAGKSFSAAERHHQLVGLGGFDWTPGSGWTLSAQYIADYVFGDDTALNRKNYRHQASLSVEKMLLNDTLSLSGLAFLDLRELTSTTQLSAEYSLTDAIKLALIGNIFLEGPEKAGLYGSYHDLSCLTLKGTVSF